VQVDDDGDPVFPIQPLQGATSLMKTL